MNPESLFIEPEFPYLYSNFNKVIIVSRHVKSDIKRLIPEDVSVYRYNPESTILELFRIPVIIIQNFKDIVSIIKQELNFRNRIQSPISMSKKLFLFKRIIKGLQLRDYLNSVLDKEKCVGPITFYSYWMNSGAYAIGLLNIKNSIKICRAHRVDL